MALDKQIQILNPDTGNFYSNHEQYLHKLNHKVRSERNKLKQVIDDLEKSLINKGFTKEDFKNISDDDLIIADHISDHFMDWDEYMSDMIIDYINLKKIYKHKTEKAKETKERILTLMQNKVEYNIKSNGKHHIRELRFINSKGKDIEPTDKNIISVFDSFFTRLIGAKENTLSEDFMVVQVYYFDVIKDCIYYGYKYKGEKYIYFTSSAGQIRTKKCVFIKESIWNKYERTLMCGLTIDKINEKGGNNPNKHLAYMALSNSATDEWKEFDINKTIVIDDFETDVYGTFDYIDDVEYTITRTNGNVTITHTDGCGMMLPNAFGIEQRNMMIRLPWVKGLLGVFDFKKFIETNNASPIIKDLYGIEHDIINEDIQVIFTKSQFKLWKYYDSWNQYKDYFKLYNCSAGFTNKEESMIKDATINYQMLQSLTDITDEEIYNIAKPSIDKLNNICTSVETIQNIFGATKYNKNKSPLQEAISIYPELLNDVYIRNKLKDIKDSLIKRYKAGKLEVKGKYTFLIPDLYAACEYWFLQIKKPNGLLNDGEVFCSLFRNSEKLDCLRSPHLYKEHGVRNNIAYKENERCNIIYEWFNTNAVYTSSRDLISRILQFDNDGDTSLVVADENIISVAERNMRDVVPLYYEMKKALPSLLNNETIYKGLSSAFTGSNIGIYSNSISKIWNNEVFINGTEEEKQNAINVVKFLCAENNYRIDFAKSLYMPERPKHINELITSFTKHLLPYFFVYAKDKDKSQVEKPNQSFINKLNNIIPNPRINCKYINKYNKSKRIQRPNYRLLMNNSKIEDDISEKYMDGINHVVVNRYLEISKNYYMKVDAISSMDLDMSSLTESKYKNIMIYNTAVKEMKNELSYLGFSDTEVADILIVYLYGLTDNKYKDILWNCYGDIILNNLKHNISTYSNLL